ncbi:MAG: DUF2452 domain-containing protein [Gammaproteobacteria bacterium]
MTSKKKIDSSGSLDRQINNLPYAASRLGANIELVDIAREIAQADAMISTRVSAKLRVIADQIRHLQQEARGILEETRRDQQLHHAECNFKRLPGKTYHLYEKNNGQLYFSMLSPNEWGGAPPHPFIGSFRLENDMSWTALDNLNEPQVDDSREIIERLLNNP